MPAASTSYLDVPASGQAGAGGEGRPRPDKGPPLAMLAAAGCVKQNNPQGWAGPVVEGDLLLASTDKGELSALKTDDFSRVWTFPSGEGKPEIKLEAIYGAPLVIDGTVYLAGYSG